MQAEFKGRPHRGSRRGRSRRERRGGWGRLLTIIFICQWLTIGVISAIDCYWSIILSDSLIETEQNPIGLWLIQFGDGNIALFMMCKIIGTILSLGILVLLYHFRPKLAHCSCFGVCVFQILLLIYLYFGSAAVTHNILNDMITKG